VRSYNGRDWPESGTSPVRLRTGHVGAPISARIAGANLPAWATEAWRADNAEKESPGMRRILATGGIELTWEWFLVDVREPWSVDVPEDVRNRINAYFVSLKRADHYIELA
jgi:hypothetical protein